MKRDDQPATLPSNLDSKLLSKKPCLLATQTIAHLYSFGIASRKASRPRLARRLLLLVILTAIFSCSFGATFGTQFTMPDEDPYKVLGIPIKDQNNMDAIKKAYRELAKKAHPDKNPHLDPEVANEKFHRINNAYEYLSNKQQKKYYDTRRKKKSWSNTNNAYRKQQEDQKRKQRQQQQEAQKRKQQQQRQRREQEKIRKAEEEKRKQEIKKLAKEAQTNLLRVTSIEDLFEHNVVNKKSQVFEKNFLCVFVSNKKIENVADNEYFFPYPFVPEGGADSIEWESVIQTAKVRFNKSTPLTKYFKVPRTLSQPYIIFVKEGTRFDKLRYKMYHTGGKHSHEKFRKWLVDQLQTTITLVNRDPAGASHIRPYFVVPGKNSRTMTVLKAAGQPLAPGYMLEIPAKLSDRIIILDESTNEFVGSSSAIRQSSIELHEDIIDLIAMDDVIVLEKGQTINVGAGHGTTRSCYDLSTTCQTWLSQKENKCQRFSAFAHSMCAKSCGVCIESPRINGLYYLFLHAPTTKIPNGVLKTIFLAIREMAKFLEMVGHDFLHLWRMRRTVLAVFLLGGLISGIQIDLSILMMLEKSSVVTSAGKKNQPSLLVLGFWFFSSMLVASILFYVYTATKVSDLFHWNGLISFHHDLVSIRRNSPEIAVIFLCVGIGSLVASKLLTYPFFRRPGLNLIGRMVFLATAVIVSFLIIVGLSLNFEERARISSHMLRINMQWAKALKLHKNVAAAMILLGHMVGNTVLILLSYIGYKLSSRKSVHLIASLANAFAACLLASLTLRDPYFLQDFEHVTSMRMSAAIPCLLIGVFTGIACSFRVFSKASVTSVSKRKKVMQHPKESLKEKVH